MIKEDIFDFDREQTVQRVWSAVSLVKSLYLPTLLSENSTNGTCGWRKVTHSFSFFSIRTNSVVSGEGAIFQHLKKCIFEEHNSLRSRNIHTCQGTYLLTDRSKETDYIVGLVRSTSGLVFSLASLRWIRKECLVRFLLSLWCFQVIVHTSHPFTLVAPSGMPLTILSAESHWEWDVWSDLFDLQLVTLQFCEATYSPYHSRCPDRQMEPLSCHYWGKLMH